MRQPSPAMIVAVVALASSLTGGAVAATVITGKNVKNSSLTGADVRNSSLTGKDVKNGSLSSADVKKGGISADRLSAAARAALKGAAGPAGVAGAAGPVGPAGPQGPAGKDNDALSTVTYSTGAGALDWTLFDLGTNENGTSINAGFSYISTGGDLGRAVVAQGVLPVTIPGGTTGRIEALHVCYRATNTARLDSVGLSRYRGDNLDPSALQLSTAILQDTTERSDAACRRFAATENQELRAGDSLRVTIQIEPNSNANNGSNRLRILSLATEMRAG